MASLAVKNTTRVALGTGRGPMPALARSSVRSCRRVSRPAYQEGPGFDSEEVKKTVNDSVSNTGAWIKGKWEETEDKPAAVMMTLAGILVLSALSGVVSAIDRIPIVSDAIELVGVGVTGWFTYRYLVFGPDREELVQNIQVFLKKVYGK